MRKAGERSFPDRYLGPLFVFVFAVFVVVSVLDSPKGGERYLLKGSDPITVSLERGEAEQGWTPVRVDIQGLVFSFWMDVTGRVFETRPRVAGRAENPAAEPPIFLLDPTQGKIRTAAWTLSGELFEGNSKSLRFRFNKLSAALILDVQGGKAALDLKGLVIPVPVLFGPDADGVRELGIGNWREDGSGRLCLDTCKKQLFWAPSDYAGRKNDTGRVIWAVS